MKKKLEQLLLEICKKQNVKTAKSASLLQLLNLHEVRDFIGDATFHKSIDFARVIAQRIDHGEKVSGRQKKLAEANIKQLEDLVVRGSVETQTYMSEANTRKVYIDTYLKEAGWEVLEKDNLIQSLKACVEIEVEGMPNSKGVGFVDYVLFGADGKPLAVVEAKRTSEKVESGKHQAVLYAECLERKYGVKPVIYCTNGYDIWMADGLYNWRQVFVYHTAAELGLLINRRTRGDVTNLAINDDITNRPYQKQAIKSVAERFNAGQRRALLVMATGTGKTRVSISLVDILTKNNWVKNVLFLADRTSLVRQAKDNFEKLMPHQTFANLSADPRADKNARIMFSTYQTMINYVEQRSNTSGVKCYVDGEKKDFSTGRFDLIIIDEAHRSIFNKFGAIFDYFDSLLVGLTATPRGEISKNTYTIFDHDDGEPTDEYSLEAAVEEGFLVNYHVHSRSTNILTEGIDREKLSKQEQEEFDRIFARNEQDDDDDFAIEPQDKEQPTKIAGSEIFKRVYNKNTCRRVIEDLMTNGIHVNSGQLLGKTIIFAYNQKHAEMIVEEFYKMHSKHDKSFCQLVTCNVKYADDLVRKFATAQEFRIAVSVDMMDTGVDVPEVVNLVFFKPVKSKIKFIQMIGRGTRLCKDLFGKGVDKQGELDDAALIFDAKMLFIELSLIVNGSAISTARGAKAVKEVCEIAATLLGKTTIPQVARKKEELKIIKSQQFWESATVDGLEKMRKALRDLMQFVRDNLTGQNFDTDFFDEVIEKEDVGGGFVDIRTYKTRVLDYLQENQNLPVIKKIKNLEQIDANDEKELERILLEELGTKSDYNKTTDKENLAVFVRSLVGISREVEQQKFGEYLTENKELNSQQIAFIRQVVNYARKNGDIAREDMFNTLPFENYDVLQYFGDKIHILMSVINTIYSTVRVG